MRYWLMKSEPDVYGIDHLAADGTTAWWGVRNYQARNFMRNQMQVGDLAFFFHSSCPEPGIAGIIEVSAPAFPDATQFDQEGRFYDPKATPDAPRWFNVEVRFKQKTRLLSLTELRQHPELANMRVLQRGNRLSITPVDPAEWAIVQGLLSVNR